jgi:hypothetical protein
MRREHISEKEARYVLKKDDEERRKWSMFLYGVDTKDPSLYDIVLNIDNLKVADAVEILTDVAKRPCFQTTPESTGIICDFYLAAKVQEILFDRFHSAGVKCHRGIVYVKIDTDLSLEQEIRAKITQTLEDSHINGIEQIRVSVIPFETGD